jgi:hypothetical protein
MPIIPPPIEPIGDIPTGGAEGGPPDTGAADTAPELETGDGSSFFFRLACGMEKNVVAEAGACSSSDASESVSFTIFSSLPEGALGAGGADGFGVGLLAPPGWKLAGRFALGRVGFAVLGRDLGRGGPPGRGGPLLLDM